MAKKPPPIIDVFNPARLSELDYLKSDGKNGYKYLHNLCNSWRVTYSWVDEHGSKQTWNSFNHKDMYQSLWDFHIKFRLDMKPFEYSLKDVPHYVIWEEINHLKSNLESTGFKYVCYDGTRDRYYYERTHVGYYIRSIRCPTAAEAAWLGVNELECERHTIPISVDYIKCDPDEIDDTKIKYNPSYVNGYAGVNYNGRQRMYLGTYRIAGMLYSTACCRTARQAAYLLYLSKNRAANEMYSLEARFKDTQVKGKKDLIRELKAEMKDIKGENVINIPAPVDLDFAASWKPKSDVPTLVTEILAAAAAIDNTSTNDAYIIKPPEDSWKEGSVYKLSAALPWETNEEYTKRTSGSLERTEEGQWLI